MLNNVMVLSLGRRICSLSALVLYLYSMTSYSIYHSYDINKYKLNKFN